MKHMRSTKKFWAYWSVTYNNSIKNLLQSIDAGAWSINPTRDKELKNLVRSPKNNKNLNNDAWSRNINKLNLIFYTLGKSSHAAIAPWEGINALDACVAMYNNVSMMRQQIKTTDRVHCVILKGGDRPNIIPDKTESWYQIRAKTNNDFETLRENLINCAEAAAKATGKEVFGIFSQFHFNTSVFESNFELHGQTSNQNFT